MSEFVIILTNHPNQLKLHDLFLELYERFKALCRYFRKVTGIFVFGVCAAKHHLYEIASRVWETMDNKEEKSNGYYHLFRAFTMLRAQESERGAENER